MAQMTMTRALKRWWKYLAVKADTTREERADPKVQLEQAIQEVKDQHQALTKQAAIVIGHQRHAQMRLDRALAELDKANGQTRQAVLLADEGARTGDVGTATQFSELAEIAAGRAIALESEVRDLEQAVLVATRQAEDAKSAVGQNAAMFKHKLAEREKLLSVLDQAKMQEALNAAMGQLNATFGADVPTFEQMRQKIEARASTAEGMAVLVASESGASYEARMIELEQAQASAAARARITEMRSLMGLPEPKALDAGSPDELSTRRLGAQELG